MSYYGLVGPAYTGHLNPISALGRELQRRGHRIAVVAPLAAKAKVKSAGLEFLPVGAVEFPDGEWERRTTRIGELTGLKANRFVGRWLGRLARGILRDVPEIAARERFDGLVMDQICIGVESVCSALRLPMAVACCALTLHAESGIPPFTFSWRCQTTLPFRVRNMLGMLLSCIAGWPAALESMRFRLRHRLPCMSFYHMNEMPPSLVQVSQQPQFFDFPRRCLPDHFHYTGPGSEPADGSDASFPWERLDGRPLIYGSLGTLQNRLPHIFRTIAEACSTLDAQLVLSLGRKGASVPENLPGNPIVVGYAPQVTLLRRSALVITHGGLNTTLESLSEGLPLVVVPITNDQPGIAARIAYLRVGEFIPVQKLTAAVMRKAVQRVLTTRTYRDRSAHCAEKLRRLNGAARAAALIENAFTSRQRIAGPPQAN